MSEQGQANEDMLVTFRKEMFALWIHSQIDSWIGEYDAWYMFFEDGDLDEEDWDYIRENLKVKSIEIVEVNDE